MKLFKVLLAEKIQRAVTNLFGEKVVFSVLYPLRAGQGDYATNVALILGQLTGEKPKEAASMLGNDLRKSMAKQIENVEVAENGFINFFLSKDYLKKSILEIADEKKPNDVFMGKGEKNINIEFVSANPTGPLTLANARAAPYGDVLGNILKRAGHKVTKEYYVNDTGRQAELLGESIARRYLQLKGEEIDYPEDMYQGSYIADIAKEMAEKGLVHSGPDDFEGIVKEAKEYGIKKNIAWIKESLEKLGIRFDVWTHESGLGNALKKILVELEQAGLTEEKDGALWLRASQFGLNKNIVIRKSTGYTTYVLSDFAYARNKLSRGFDKNIYILGADHHEDIEKIRTGLRALKLDEGKFTFLLHQLITLVEKGEKMRMSKRQGKFVLLDELLKEIPKDVVRYFFLMRSLEAHIDFDVELAKTESSKNPVYAIQYAHARACSIFRKYGEERGKKAADFINNKEVNKAMETYVFDEEERVLAVHLLRFPEVLDDISASYQVHALPVYTLELARMFHGFYERHQILKEEGPIMNARLVLAAAVKNVIADSLKLMGISSPEHM